MTVGCAAWGVGWLGGGDWNRVGGIGCLGWVGRCARWGWGSD